MSKAFRVATTLAIMFNSLLMAKASAHGPVQVPAKKAKRGSKRSRKDSNAKLKSLNKTLLQTLNGNPPSSINGKKLKRHKSALSIAKDREAELLKLMQGGKIAELEEASLDSNTISSLPSEIQDHIEKPSELSGQLSVIYEDKKDDVSELLYSLETDDGESIAIYPDKDIHSYAGKHLKLKGLQTGHNLAIKTEGLKKLEIIDDGADQLVLNPNLKGRKKAKQPDSVGKQKTLVILAQDASDPSGSKQATKSQVRKKYFGNDGNSVNDFIVANSYGKASITGEVTGWTSVKNLCEATKFEHSGFAYSQLAQKILKKVSSKQNIGKYSRFVFVLPSNSTTTRSCFQRGTQGIGTVGKAKLKIGKKNVKASFNFIKAGTLDSAVAAHEFGHNFGATHADSYDCGEHTIDHRGRCKQVEYGDVFSVMGNLSRSHFNAVRKEKFGWFEKSQVKTISGRTNKIITLTATEIEGGVKAIKINKKDGYTYILEYHQPIVKDKTQENLQHNGVIIHEAHKNPFFQTRLLDATPKSISVGAADFFDAPLEIGKRFTDPANGINVEVIGISSNEATVKVTVDG